MHTKTNIIDTDKRLFSFSLWTVILPLLHPEKHLQDNSEDLDQTEPTGVLNMRNQMQWDCFSRLSWLMYI